jgi:hypothetical protein
MGLARGPVTLHPSPCWATAWPGASFKGCCIGFCVPGASLRGQTPGCGGRRSTAFDVRPWKDPSPPPGRLPPWLVEPRRLGRRFRAPSFHPPEECRTSLVEWKACGSTIVYSWAILAALTIPAQRRRPRLRVPTEPRRGSLVRSPWEVAVASTREGPSGPGGGSGRLPTPARAWGCLPWLRVLTEPWRGGLARPPWEAAVVPTWGVPPTTGIMATWVLTRPRRAAPLKTLRWVRQQTQEHWHRGRPLAALKTLSRAVQQPQAQRLWQRQHHLPTINLSRAGPGNGQALRRPAAHHPRTGIPTE